MARAIRLSTCSLLLAFLAAILPGCGDAPGTFLIPVSGTVTSSYYSARPGGIHAALDIAAVTWTPIIAARSGVVSFAGWNSGGYGNLVILDHGSGYQTYYAHQVSVAVGWGQHVAVGQIIGYVGTTGASTGPHLHFEIRRWGSRLFVPGSVGNWMTQGNDVPYGYEGI